MYIITHTTDCGEYTPSKADTLQDAKAWMQKCIAYEIRSTVDGLEGLSDLNVIEWAKNNIYEFELNETSMYVEFANGDYDSMQIYNIDELQDTNFSVAVRNGAGADWIKQCADQFSKEELIYIITLYDKAIANLDKYMHNAEVEDYEVQKCLRNEIADALDHLRQQT